MPGRPEGGAADGTSARRKPVVGDLHWDGAVWRRWSGRHWPQAAYSLDPDRLEEPARLDAGTPVGQDRRRRALSLAVEDQVEADDWGNVWAQPVAGS